MRRPDERAAGMTLAALATAACPDRPAALVAALVPALGDLPFAVMLRAANGPARDATHGLDADEHARVAHALHVWADHVTDATADVTTVATAAGERAVALHRARATNVEVALAVVDTAGIDPRTTQRLQLLTDVMAATAPSPDAEAPTPRFDDTTTSLLDAMSHELRTPLTIVRGLSETLVEHHGQLAPERLADLLERIAGSARRLDALVSDMLDLDQFRRGIGRIRRGPGRLDVVVTNWAARTHPARRARLELDVEPTAAVLDVDCVHRILDHLVDNAVRYSPDDTPIHVRVRRVPGGAVLSVIDHGAGVRPDLRSRIFEPFGRGSELRSHAPGLGIGLALVREVCSALGGRVWVAGRDDGGSGAAFHVRLQRPARSTMTARTEDTDDVPSTSIAA